MNLTSDVAKVYDMLMSFPGMEETVKIDLRISRKNVLLLNGVIEKGVSGKDDAGAAGLLEALPKEVVEEFKLLAADCLQKAGLTEFNNKLKALNSK
ncbi:hypothetical protein [Mucilaginibacter paludis]|uniref:Uncharacterized protein n=1 Tax=Mucilaginibacter paludis DSM 18603 TaxID=714943 RepID=H1YBX0_9SPHI|nr:hypothetical protein [Mucilaginibacter paludis]EHQ27048.1 hypothetical protein Mucpa_2940 [Mucilaginibacter paludis DSM 18603]